MDAPHNSTDSDGNAIAGMVLAIPVSLGIWFGLCWLALRISTHIYAVLLALAFASLIGAATARFWRQAQ